MGPRIIHTFARCFCAVGPHQIFFLLPYQRTPPCGCYSEQEVKFPVKRPRTPQCARLAVAAALAVRLRPPWPDERAGALAVRSPCPLPASRTHAGLPRAVPATLLASRAAAEGRRRHRPGSPTPPPLPSPPALRAPGGRHPPLASARCPHHRTARSDHDLLSVYPVAALLLRSFASSLHPGFLFALHDPVCYHYVVAYTFLICARFIRCMNNLCYLGFGA